MKSLRPAVIYLPFWLAIHRSGDDRTRTTIVFSWQAYEEENVSCVVLPAGTKWGAISWLVFTWFMNKVICLQVLSFPEQVIYRVAYLSLTPKLITANKFNRGAHCEMGNDVYPVLPLQGERQVLLSSWTFVAPSR